MSTPAGTTRTGPLPADDYNRDGLSRNPDSEVELERGFAHLRDIRGLPLGTLAITGRTVKIVPFPPIGGPEGRLYLAFNSAHREDWGHVYEGDLAGLPRTIPGKEAGNGTRPPRPHDDLHDAEGRRLAYVVRPKPIPYPLFYKNSIEGVEDRTAGASFRNYGAYEGPSGNGAYRDERPDEDRHHQPLCWSTVRRADGTKVDGGGVAKAFLSDGEVFYRANVEPVVIEACSAVSPCPNDDGERPDTSAGLEGRVTSFYGYVWTKEAGRQYGWTVASWQVGPPDSPTVHNLEPAPQG